MNVVCVDVWMCGCRSFLWMYPNVFLGCCVSVDPLSLFVAFVVPAVLLVPSPSALAAPLSAHSSPWMLIACLFVAFGATLSSLLPRIRSPPPFSAVPRNLESLPTSVLNDVHSRGTWYYSYDNPCYVENILAYT